jgi:hypothetical protein
MRSRAFASALLSTLVLFLAPQTSYGSAVPASLSLRWGAGVGLGPNGSGRSFAPSLSATWPLARNVALWSCVSYMRETTESIVLRPLITPTLGYAPGATSITGGSLETHFIPITLGLRGYARNDQGRPQGLFIEGGPSCVLARYWAAGGGHRTAVLGGVQIGTGVRFPTSDRSHGEVGMGYYLADGIGDYSDAVGRIGLPHRADLGVFSLYLALGFGN